MNAADIASRIGAKGQAVTIAGNASSTYDPATSSASGSAYAATATAALFPLTPYRIQSSSDIEAGDEQMLLSAVGSDGAAIGKPPLGAIVTLADGTSKYTLIAVDPLHPAGDELLYDCVVRGH